MTMSDEREEGGLEESDGEEPKEDPLAGVDLDKTQDDDDPFAKLRTEIDYSKLKKPPGYDKMDARAQLASMAAQMDPEVFAPSMKPHKTDIMKAVEERRRQDKKEDTWLRDSLKLALLKNRYVQEAADRYTMNNLMNDKIDWYRAEGQKVKEDFVKEAEKANEEAMARFKKEEEQLMKNIDDIIAKNSLNMTNPLRSETPAFPEDLTTRAGLEADELEALMTGVGVREAGATDKFESLKDSATASAAATLDLAAEGGLGGSGSDALDTEKEQLSRLNPSEVVSAASAQVAARVASAARKNASIAAQIETLPGVVLVVGSDTTVGKETLKRFSSATAMSTAGAGANDSVAGVPAVEAAQGLTLEEAKYSLGTGEVGGLLGSVKTLVLALEPPQQAGGGGLGGMFGLGGGGAGGSKGTLVGGSLSDDETVALLAACGPSLRHVLCLSVEGGGGGGLFGSPGGGGRGGFPAGSPMEQAVKRFTKAKRLEHTAVRASRLVPAEEMRGKANGLVTPKNVPKITAGVVTPATRELAADALFQAAGVPLSFRNTTFAVSNVGGGGGAAEGAGRPEWDDQMLKLRGPELSRTRLPELRADGSKFTNAAWSFLQDWAEEWKKPGKGLTTPVRVYSDEAKRTVGIHFNPSVKNYLSSREERELEKNRKAYGSTSPEGVSKTRPSGAESEGGTGAAEKERVEGGEGLGEAVGEGMGEGNGSRVMEMATKEGGIDFIVEDFPYPRVRAVRANMTPKTVVKEMSEEVILRDFEKRVVTPLLK